MAFLAVKSLNPKLAKVDATRRKERICLNQTPQNWRGVPRRRNLL